MIVAGVITTIIVSLFILSLIVVWGIGNAKGEGEISKMIEGSWVIDADTFGKTQVMEVFNADGTWVCGNADDILRKGRWQYVDNMQIKIKETEVTVGNVTESINYERIIEIINLEYDQIICKEDDRQFVLNRIRPPGFPKN